MQYIINYLHNPSYYTNNHQQTSNNSHLPLYIKKGVRALLISPFRSKEDKEGARFSGFAQNNGCVHGVRAYVLCLREYIYITLKNWIIHGKMRKNGVRALLISPFRSKGVRGNVKNSLALLNMT